MLLENVGVRLEVTNPVDIAYLKALGWKEVKESEPKKEPDEKQEEKKAVKDVSTRK